jgi:hypothetical protein
MTIGSNSMGPFANQYMAIGGDSMVLKEEDRILLLDSIQSRLTALETKVDKLMKFTDIEGD